MRLVAELRLRTGAERVENVDHQSVGRGSERQRAGVHQQRDDVEEKGKVRGDVQGVVEGQHQQVTEKNGDVIPDRLLFQGGRGRETRLLDQSTETPDDLAREEQGVGTGQGHRGVGEDLCGQRAETAEHRALDETVENDVQEIAHLSDVRPDLRLDRRVHVVLLDGQSDQLVENHRDLRSLVVVVLLAEASEVRQPFGHVLQTEVFQLDRRVAKAFDALLEELQGQMRLFQGQLLRDGLDEDRVV